jgi:hypothetical protein
MVGPEKSYTMLKTYKNIENVLDELKKLKNKDNSPKYTDEMFLPLKYKRCRELFTTKPVNFNVKYSGFPDFKIVKEFFYINSIKFNIEKLKKNMSTREPILIFEDYVENVENVAEKKYEDDEKCQETIKVEGKDEIKNEKEITNDKLNETDIELEDEILIEE